MPKHQITAPEKPRPTARSRASTAYTLAAYRYADVVDDKEAPAGAAIIALKHLLKTRLRLQTM